MEKFIKIYYSLLHSDLAHSSQLIYSFLLYAYEMNNKLKKRPSPYGLLRSDGQR
nr:hypothetical protein DLTAUQXX_DLTAUQXX_CDS_0056 [uncultured phage]CAI9750152.1 hypothetical protein LUIDIZRK_LUIDIZRK_CDS_0056 [uncultured phage]